MVLPKDILLPSTTPGYYQHVVRKKVLPAHCTEKLGGLPNDILLPSTTPGYYQHVARKPNTNTIQAWHNKQRKSANEQLQEFSGIKTAIRDSMMIEYDKHAEKRWFEHRIRERVQQKLQVHEETIEKRREKLRDMLCNDENQYYYETIDWAQKMDEMKMEEMKRRAEQLKSKREEERLKIVHQKRIEQYRNRCHELRPSVAKQHLVETKNGQLQQIRENELKREADRELNRMWRDVTRKDIKAKMERETQELIARNQNQQDLQSIWEKQIRGKELLKAEEEKVAQEDRMEMEKLREQLRREEIEGLDSKRRKRDRIARELLEQIATQEQLFMKRKQDEDSVDQAFTKLAELEVERVNQAFQDYSLQARRETALYKKHLMELEEERKKEERELDELLLIHGKEIEKKHDVAKCRLEEAKMKLQKDVLQGRAEQIVYKRQQAENQLKLKQAENELLRMAFEKNERLQAESDRLEAEAVRQYRDDLQQQIDYNNVLREREKQELERQLEEGRKEEEMYQKIVEDMIKENVQNDMKHPFRRVLEGYDCRCTSKPPFPCD